MKTNILVIIVMLLLMSGAANATDVTWPDKTTGDRLSAAEANEVKAAVNSKENTTDVDTDNAAQDALIAAQMERQRITEVYSYDRGFDQVPEVTRLEP